MNTFDPTKYTRSKWLKGSDLRPGRPVTVTIKAAFEQHFEQNDETKPALSFDELDQSLIMNKTQIQTMIELYSEDPRVWIGQRINLLPVPSNYQGKPTILITSAEVSPTVNGQRPPQRQPARQSAQYSREDYAAQQPPDLPDNWPTDEPPGNDELPF